jgi:hypothetical protein
VEQGVPAAEGWNPLHLPQGTLSEKCVGPWALVAFSSQCFCWEHTKTYIKL